jgi:hypothetical protein
LVLGELLEVDSVVQRAPCSTVLARAHGRRRPALVQDEAVNFEDAPNPIISVNVLPA